MISPAVRKTDRKELSLLFWMCMLVFAVALFVPVIPSRGKWVPLFIFYGAAVDDERWVDLALLLAGHLFVASTLGKLLTFGIRKFVPERAASPETQRERARMGMSLYIMGAGALLAAFFRDWEISGIPARLFGFVIIVTGLLGLLGVNVFVGGTLDKRKDPD